MELKTYQRATLDALRRFLEVARAAGPAEAFARTAPEGAPAYRPLTALPDVPYVCLRLPTGGGKTILAAESTGIAGDAYLESEFPLVMWMVTSDRIKKQTIEALNDWSHAYRRVLDARFAGRVRVFDIEDFADIRPQDVGRQACLIVGTIQTFRVTDTANRKVYAHHEELEPHFARIPPLDNMERIDGGDGIRFSFANLLHHHRPLMIVDEAHNVISGLSQEVQARIRPAAIIEFTATPRGLNNILHLVTATALKDEEMIKLPVRVRPHADWQDAVSSAVATRNTLEEKARREAEHLRPVALFQAQNRTGAVTVDVLRSYLEKEKLIPPSWIAVATGEQRELDGVNLADPGCPIRYVITVEALKEGWDCPSAYVFCSVARVASLTAVEQLLGRVLRMPYAKRRKDPALNMAYAHVSEPSFHEAAQALRDKLISMGFTDEEVRESLKPATLEEDDQGHLFDPSERPALVMTHRLPDSEDARTRLAELAEDGVEYRIDPDGELVVGIRGGVSARVLETLEAATPETARPTLRANAERHNERVERGRSRAEKGEVIRVPRLMVEIDGQLEFADIETIMEVVPWSILSHPAGLGEKELAFDRDDNLIEIDIADEKLVYRAVTAHATIHPALGVAEPEDVWTENRFAAWLERKCRHPEIPQAEMLAWITQLVAHLTHARGMPVRELVDWQYQIVKAIGAKVAEIRRIERGRAYQAALFGDDSRLNVPLEHAFRFEAGMFEGVPLHPPTPARFSRHLLGNDRIPAFDGDVAGEEFQCAFCLDSLDEVDVWVRNVAQHRQAFWLPLASGRFYPDFVARLTDGRIFVVEYKGDLTAGTTDTREKRLIGERWARTAGGVFAIIERMRHGRDMRAQFLDAIRG
jgi:type III restriction enzyme